MVVMRAVVMSFEVVSLEPDRSKSRKQIPLGMTERKASAKQK